MQQDQSNQEQEKKFFTREEFEKDFFKVQNDDISVNDINFTDKNTEKIRKSVVNPESIKKFFNDAEKFLNE